MEGLLSHLQMAFKEMKFFAQVIQLKRVKLGFGGQSSLISDPLLLPHHYHVKNEGTANINVPMNHLGILL